METSEIISDHWDYPKKNYHKYTEKQSKDRFRSREKNQNMSRVHKTIQNEKEIQVSLTKEIYTKRDKVDIIATRNEMLLVESVESQQSMNRSRR